MRIGGNGGTSGFRADDGAAPLRLGQKELLIWGEAVDRWFRASSFA